MKVNFQIKSAFWLVTFSLIFSLSFNEHSYAKSKPLFLEAVDYTTIETVGDCKETLHHGKKRKYSRCANPDKLFEAAKTFALEKKIPLVILWGFDACPACENLERVFFDPEMLPTNKAVSELLTPQQKEQFSNYTNGSNQLALVRMNSGTSIQHNQDFANEIGANKLASTLGSDKVWSPMFMVYNPETSTLAANQHFYGQSYCNFSEEIAQGLEQVGIIKDDPNWDRSCYMPEDPTDEVLTKWKTECKAGSYAKCFWVGSAYKQKYYDEQEADLKTAEDFRKRAVKFLKKSCDNGLFTACRSVGYILPKNGEEYKPEAMNFFKRACNRRDMRACGQVAFGYQYGEGGLQKSNPKAAMYYAKVCDSHYPWACSKLGEMALYRDAGTSDYHARAKQLIAFGCRDGNDWACKEKYK